MFTYFCILIAFILARKSYYEYRAIAYIVLFEFTFHKVMYVGGVQLTGMLDNSFLYLSYMIIQLAALRAIIDIQSHKTISILIYTNLAYNMLTISQYSINIYDFVSAYAYVVGFIMVLELAYLAWITTYVTNHRRKHGFTSTNYIDFHFFVRRRIQNGRQA